MLFDLDHRTIGHAEVHSDDDAVSLEHDSVALDLRPHTVRDGGKAPPQGDQAAVPLEHAAMVRLVNLVPIELRPLEGAGVLRVRHLTSPAERGELAPTSFGHSLAQPWISAGGAVPE